MVQVLLGNSFRTGRQEEVRREEKCREKVISDNSQACAGQAVNLGHSPNRNRTKTDTGMVVILDPRALRSIFLASLTECAVKIEGRS
jgi:hypothetical protein